MVVEFAQFNNHQLRHDKKMKLHWIPASFLNNLLHFDVRFIHILLSFWIVEAGILEINFYNQDSMMTVKSMFS